MQKTGQILHDLKLFLVISLSTGLMIILGTLLGHFIRAGNLIPYAMAGGSAGILAGVYVLYRRNLIHENNIIAVSVSTLAAFGIVSLIIIFNFDKPLLIFCGLLLIGLTTTFSNQYFEKYKYVSAGLKFGVLGVVLIFPAFYFIASSILKFSFGLNVPFDFIEGLLKSSHGQANFNAISPFIFGGGLALTFLINLLAQIQFVKSESSLIRYRPVRTKLQPLNFTLLLMSCLLSLVLLTYLFLEN